MSQLGSPKESVTPGHKLLTVTKQALATASLQNPTSKLPLIPHPTPYTSAMSTHHHFANCLRSSLVLRNKTAQLRADISFPCAYPGPMPLLPTLTTAKNAELI